jgi:hypothetical protein
MNESPRHIQPSWVAFGWFISVGGAALVLLALAAFRLVAYDPSTEGVWISLALLLGFAFGGFATGTRVRAAPALHGLGIGLFSLVVWVLVNVFLGEPTGETTWRSLPFTTVALLILLQVASAVVGARFGYRWSRPSAT